MLPFFNTRMYRNNYQAFAKYVDKMNRNELTLEEVLENEDLVQDIKNNPSSQLAPFLSSEVIRELIDYATKMPETDDQRYGHKFPFNACEILCSENGFVVDRFLEEQKIYADDEDSETDPERKVSNVSKDEDSNNEELKEVSEDKAPVSEVDPLDNGSASMPQQKLIHHKKQKAQYQDLMPEEDQDFFNLSQENVSEYREGEREFKVLLDNLDYFYMFLDEEPHGVLNHVLVGYFGKIFHNLLNQKSALVLTHLQRNKVKVIPTFVKNLNRKAVGECLNRVLTAQHDDLVFLEELKVELINKIFDSISPEKEEFLETISEMFINCLSKKKFHQIFLDNFSLLKKLHEKVSENINHVEVTKELLKILIKINENFIKDFPGAVTPSFAADTENFFNFSNFDVMDEESNLENINNMQRPGGNERFSKNLGEVLKILSSSAKVIFRDFPSVPTQALNDQSKFGAFTTYDRPRKILGSKKMLEFEYFKTLLDILINSASTSLGAELVAESLNIFINTGIFSTAIAHFYEFEFNNVYQKLLEQVIILLTNKYTPKKLVDYVFDPEMKPGCNLLVSLVTHCENNLKFNFNSGKTINSGFFAILCEICHHIYTSGNTRIQDLLDNNDRFVHFFLSFVEPVRKRFNAGLLYNVNEGKVFMNFDNLNSPNMENSQDDLHKDIDSNDSPSIPLNQLIKNNMHCFIYSANRREKIFQRKPSYIQVDEDKVSSPLNLQDNPMEFVDNDNNIIRESGTEASIQARLDEPVEITTEASAESDQATDMSSFSDLFYWKLKLQGEDVLEDLNI